MKNNKTLPQPDKNPLTPFIQEPKKHIYLLFLNHLNQKLHLLNQRENSFDKINLL